MRRLAALTLGMLALAGSGAAQEADAARQTIVAPAALRGDFFHIESAEVGRGFDIYVRYPDGYAASDATYPVVYLTDGDSLFPILAANHLFLTYDEGLPEAIVVGIAYGGFDPVVNRRNVDFQAPGEGVAVSGVEAFQRFLKTELIPRIEREYRADPERRVLFGQSRGGAFVLWSAINDPDLFWGRIASNPSMTPGMKSLMAAAGSSTRDDLAVVVTSGTRDRPDLQREAADWLAHWQATTDKPWTVHGVRIEGGTHAANATDAYREGLLKLFGGASQAAPGADH